MVNPFDMMKNLGDIQNKLQEAQAKMESVQATGSAGGNMVQVTLNGKFDMKAIKIDPIAVDPRDVNMLQDLIVAAHNNAMEKVQEQLKSGLDLSSFMK